MPIDEVPSRPRAIEGLSTTIAGFVGPTSSGPAEGTPPLLKSIADFEQAYGGPGPLAFDGQSSPNDVAHAVRGFFENGGRELYVARVRAAEGQRPAPAAYDAALAVLAELPDISIVAAPGATRGSADDSLAVAQLLVAHCEQLPRRFAILDTPAGAEPAGVLTYRQALGSSRAALYYPWVEVVDPTTQATVTVPPSGFVAGVYVRTDTERGVHRPPVNTEVRSVVGLERAVSQREQELLNPAGVNCLRHFRDRGHLVWGARTVSSDPEWKYVSVRRYLSYLERSIGQGTQWAVFEPHAEPLWSDVRRAVESFMLMEFREGRLPGATPDEAFFVRCDRTTMTQADIDNGRLICLVGVAPIQPAEFVIFRIAQLTADAVA